MSATGDSIRDLVAAAQHGNAAARETLMRQQLSGLRAFVRLRSDGALRMKESESDLVQSICREVLSDLGGFEYRDESSFRSWLFTVALNKIREKGRFHSADRRSARHESGSLDADSDLSQQYASIFTPSEHAIGKEAEQQFESAFDRLSEDHREVILHSRILRLSHAEIAKRLAKTEVAVRSLLSRALVALSAELTRKRS